MHVFITGATGLIGSRLVEQLLKRNDTVTVLSRRPETARQKWGERVRVVEGDPTVAGSWMEAIHSVDAVVNLAGEGILNRRWNADFKQKLVESRIKATQNVVTALTSAARTSPDKPRTLVSASAIGYYGPHGDEALDETSAPGDDFMARLCVDWEQAAQTASPHGIRVVLVRIGVVLDPAGGALQKMVTPFKLFAGGPIGDGKQVVSWIHIDDMVGLLLFALDHREVVGPLNATAPQPATNRAFSTVLGKALHRPSFLPTPLFALRLALGEAAAVVTKGQRVLPHKAQAHGYPFKYRDIGTALQQLVGSQ